MCIRDRYQRRVHGENIFHQSFSRTKEMAIPVTRKAFCLDGETKKCSWQEIEVPQLIENQILIRVEASALNDIDFVYIQGGKGFGSTPGNHILGVEGAGVVIASGPGNGSALVGQRVSFMLARGGAWTDFAIVHVNDILLIDDKYSIEEAAGALVVPLTALMFLDLAKRLLCKTVVNTAASSCVGRSTFRLLQLSDIEVINIVRKQEKAAQLLNEGAKFVLNSSDENFKTEYPILASKLWVNLLLDCVGGHFLTELINITPAGASICSYGSLSGTPFTTMLNVDLFAGKVLMSVNVFNFWSKLFVEDRIKLSSIINESLNTTFKTNILKVFPFASLEEALKFREDNRKGESIDGKIIVKWESKPVSYTHLTLPTIYSV
eukprot:TRINITY_DN6180_c0_g1_i1.p1 TRINITY_DN6180_c0_g1~~TRINITY_DN6180_c0_g1_i1.p1  ORF type:complete len:398 (-),score=110.46 TRINITY_DN6180_c0_g1_i1:35-1168(-)